MAKQHAQLLQWFGPILDALRELEGSGKPREVAEWIAERCGLTDEQLDETYKSGNPKFYNQVTQARQYLVWEGLLDGSTRGVWILTEKGSETHLNEEDARKIYLKWVKIHREARKNADDEEPTSTDKVEPEATEPKEADVADDDHRQVLLEILKKVTPEGFERISARLLRESGFEKVNVTGRPKDEGIDGIGILQINPFVSFKVLFQCKRYKGSVSRAQVGDFRNAMMGRADKGIIITTGSFTADARKEAERDGAAPVELVDGEKLVEMFEGVELGLKPKTVYEVDHAFFTGFLPDES